jgi:glyoxylase-like metal-dependent hydrolase (beta-lactamase superfamily II)
MLKSSIVGSAVKEGLDGVNSENAAINETRKSQMTGTKHKPLYIRALQIVAPALLVIGLVAYGQEFSDKPIISLSTVSKLDRSQAGIYRTKVGKIDVIALSDGTVGLGLTKELIQKAKPGEVERLLARHFEKSPLDASVNAFLIMYEDKLVLIDAGSSELVGPTAGKLPQSLRAAGAPPENITDVFVTHIHPDHTGGLMNRTTKVFPNATIHINKREVDYWFDKSIAATAVEPQKTFFAQVDAKVKPYMDSGQLKTFEGATEFFPGFRAEPAYGHTAGLTVYVLENGGEKVMFWGDVVNIALQVDDPDISLRFDSDAAAAAATRRKLLEDAVRKGYIVAPAHLPFPGLGHIRKDGHAYAWVPVDYVNDAIEK